MPAFSNTMTYPICNIYFQVKGDNPSKKRSTGVKFYYTSVMLTNTPHSKFQFDMQERTEIISWKPRTEGRTDAKINGHVLHIIALIKRRSYQKGAHFDTFISIHHRILSIQNMEPQTHSQTNFY
jgi:hypothetical protein